MITVPFIGPDSESLFKTNCEKFGKEWYYYNKSITYTFNSKKFRMNKELADVDYDNYIYFSGCSYTFGLGVEYEKTFPVLVSNFLNSDFVNSSIIGASVELVFYNTIDFLSECPRPPKNIILNWPDTFRTMWWENNGEIRLYMPKEYSGNWKQSYKDFLIHDTHVFNRFHYIRKTIQTLCKSLSINLLEISTALHFDPYKNSVFDNIHVMPSMHDRSLLENKNQTGIIHTSWARDVGFHGGGHPGWNHHEYVSSFILNWINT